MLSSGIKCYHLGCNHLELMLSSGTKCYHLGRNVIVWDALLSSGAKVIIWDEMLSSGIKYYHLELMLSCYHLGQNAIIGNEMLSSGMQCYHLGRNFIWICIANEGNVFICCYHVMLSSGMITPPVLFFLQTSLTPIHIVS